MSRLVQAWTRFRQSIYFYPIVLFLAVRIGLFVWASLSIALVPVQVEKVRLYYGMTPLTTGLDQLVWSPWQRGDTIWYTKIAEQGYSDQDLSIAFFPLFPLLIRAVMQLVPINSVAAGVIIASVAGLTSFVLFFKLSVEVLGERAARRALLMWTVFPTTFFLFAAYTESLFLTFALMSLILARSRRWELAGVLGGLAALTRPQGALLVFALLVEFAEQWRKGKTSIWRAANLITVMIGALIYIGYMIFTFQNPLIWFQAQAKWRQPAMPWESLGQAIGVVLRAQDGIDLFFSVIDPLSALLFIGLMFVCVVRLGTSFAVYMAIVILPPLFGITTYSHLLPLASFTRYAVAAFPGFMVLGQSERFARFQKPLIAIGLVFQMIWLFLFTHWIFVG